MTGSDWNYVQYLGANGEIIQALVSRLTGQRRSEIQTGTAPNLDSFQLYSLGSNGVGNLRNRPPTSMSIPPNAQTPGRLQQTHFLANWEE